ncbi:cupin domain-containing protein [Shewanella sp. 202IG2-18]|uniref:ChrR family anti-sigma-E factor n=1 Tax=Parashewanella hymeniacidonis TaxID=2807618 RepID=UPI0019608312|nr:ChrR family anti-sigma-E factor [Parashewanella hymeniacidonis]MBM7074353.1 cupin domain-containing protein [Parashewanella hymeniacidonis]
MIKHHPTDDLLIAFSAGELSSSLSVVISTHIEMCPVCRHQVERYTAQMSDESLNQQPEVIDFAANSDDIGTDANFDEMLSGIIAEPESNFAETFKSTPSKVIGDGFELPKSLSRLNVSNFVNVGKISRARIELDEEPVRTSLLNIKAGGEVPHHTHKGFEITLLLQGKFEDELGGYVPGDFIILDAEHTHHPVSKEGCWCLTVVNDSIQFTKGVNRLLNPLGKFIY